MPRIPRGDQSGEVQHIINRGNARMAVFHDDEDYQKFIDLLQKGRERNAIELMAFCLMPNHYHLALRSKKPGSMSRFMQWLHTSYVRYHHQKYQSSGHLWQGRYKNFLVQSEGYLWVLIKYIEANPLRAGLVDRAQAWPYSSLVHRIRPAGEPMLARLPIALPVHWVDEVNTPMKSSQLDSLRQSVNRQAPFGQADWCVQQAAQNGLESTLRPRGRPKKPPKESKS